MHNVFARSALLPVLALSTPASADTAVPAQPERDYLGEEIIVTAKRDGYQTGDGSSATKTSTPIIDVPQTVATITRDQLDDQNLRSLNDALRFVPGVSIETGEGHRDQLAIRGQETTADFYIDGLRDDAQYYRPLYNIERVEVLKGPNALIFGRGAGGGAVNRVSKQAQLGQSMIAGMASVDTFGAFDLATDLATPLSDAAALRFNATYEEFASNRDAYGGRFIGISPTATLALGDSTRLIASYTYDDDERVVDRGIPPFAGRPLAGVYDTFFGDREFNRSEVEAHVARARVEHGFAGGLSANASLQYATYDKFYGNIVPGAALDNDDDGIADTVRLSGYDSGTGRDNWIGQANLIWAGATGAVGHTLLLGAEIVRQDTDAVRNQVRFAGGAASVSTPISDTISIPAFTLSPQRASRSQLEVYSVYAQDQIDLTDWLQVIAGARFDSFQLDSVDLVTGFAGKRTDEKLSPRFGVVLKPRPNLSLYASYAESFLPASGDQFTVLSRTSVLLDPEEFENLEIGVKWAPRPDLLATIAVFRLDRSNTPAVDDQGFTVLTGASRVQGVELSLAGSLSRRLHVNLGYTYLDGEIRSATTEADVGTRLQQAPEHQIGAWGRYDLNNRFGLGLGVVHQGDQFASNSNDVLLPAYTRIDAAAYYRLGDRLSVQLNVENLTDEAYFPSAHGDNNIQPGRPFSACFGVRFAY